MRDKYLNFADLEKQEKRGNDFQIRLLDRAVGVVIAAPHGGGIEPGTSELAEAIAGANLSFYAFEGTKHEKNLQLHITSTNFDEPSGLGLIVKSDRVIAIHGVDRVEPAVILGGLDEVLIHRARESLRQRGFPVRMNVKGLLGREAKNICNRGIAGIGLQIEISTGLRKTFFQSLRTRVGRQTKTDRFWHFVAAVREIV